VITMKELKEQLRYYRHIINKQQLRTLQGQMKAGDIEGAKRGLQKILGRKMSKRDIFINAHRGTRYMKDVDYSAQFSINLKHVYEHVR